MFGVDPDCICSQGGPNQLLIGQDSGRILLKPLTTIKGREVSSYMANIAKDLSLNTSMATKQFSICGAIGGKSSITDASSIYRVNMISTTFSSMKHPAVEMLTI